MTSAVFGPEWFERMRHPSAHSLPRNKVPFDRKTFVEEVKAAVQDTDQHHDAGFVWEYKRRRDFASSVIAAYESFTDEQKLEMLLALALDLGSQDMSLLVRSLPSLLRAHLVFQVLAAALGFNPPTDLDTYKHVKHGLVPVPEHFCILLGSVPNGYAFLLGVRSDLSMCLKKYHRILPNHEVRALTYFDILLRDLFATQSGVHFRSIDLTPENAETIAVVLQKERVHVMRSWADLRQRLDGPNRRCYGMFHSNLSHQPLVFLETYVTKELCSNIESILNPAQSQIEVPLTNPTHAIFYSISNTHHGLRGLNLASHLLFLTITRISKQYPSIHTFATLSPVPTFKQWFVYQITMNPIKQNHQLSWFTAENLQVLTEVFGVNALAASKWLRKQLDTNEWRSKPHAELFEELAKDVLTRLALNYILFEREPIPVGEDDGPSSHRIVDPVANFHLQNGAQVERLNFAADLSPRGLEQSYGLMINYKYTIKSVDVTSMSYKRNSTVALSPCLLSILWPQPNPIFEAIQAPKAPPILVLAKQFAKGDVILTRGRNPHAIYFLCKGRVQVASAPMCTLEQGSMFGHQEIQNREPVRYTIRALSRCHVLFVRQADMMLLQQSTMNARL
ncbi:malonyl-CoA decarboxylase (MCD) [Thraustotheca clavata]|uniref:Malonyl-CoA decarboxylase (MCD) n=1 Tax=Thraustotheca clavata TaxID=74557 RepID=A0A1V9ZVA4_9STRA|nr:malonyl-CoA decarboxylase (MCD) [Thraustotheca clavata]